MLKYVDMKYNFKHCEHRIATYVLENKKKSNLGHSHLNTSHLNDYYHEVYKSVEYDCVATFT